MSIGIANICSRVQDHRQKFISKALVLKEQKIAKEACVARQSLKTARV